MTCGCNPHVEAAQLSAVEELRQAHLRQQAPHVLLRPRVFPDGDMWCALYGENLMEGVSGFGTTPHKACADFDHNWLSERAWKGVEADAGQEGGK